MGNSSFAVLYAGLHILSISLLNLWSCSHILQENITVCFAYILFTFHFLRLKQKRDSLLFLIKKHNHNKTAGYNDIAYIIY